MMIWKVLRGFLASIGFLVLFMAVLGAWGLVKAVPELPDSFVLDVTLNGTPADRAGPQDIFEAFFDGEPRLADMTDMIANAGQDDRVEALIVRLGGGTYEWTAVQELRTAIAAFKAAGKKAYVFADSYGDLYSAMGEYYLASAFDEVWVQPVGSVTITGFATQTPYVKGLLDRLGVKAQMFQSGEYKTGPENMLRTDMSAAQKAMLSGILSSRMTDFFDGVAGARGLEPSQIGMLIDGAPYTAKEAQVRKLVDRVGYWDELLVHVEENHGDAQALVDTENYLGSDLPLLSKVGARKGGVVLVHVNGMIVPEDIYGGGLMAEPMAPADVIAEQINNASQDDDVQAIVLRVVSPGGSPTASETIRRAVEVAKSRGKYVVVSMGEVAASGGYWVSVDADKIFALDGTLTGSIGVFGGKMDLSDLWKHVDVNWEGVKLGANAGMWSANNPFTEDEALAVERMIKVTDDAFIERVANGRGFAQDVVKKLAGGRVWTGRQAKANGLVDELGGLQDAFDHVAKHLGVGNRNNLDIWVMQRDGHPAKFLSGFLRGVRMTFAPYVNAWVLAKNPSFGTALAPVGR